MAEAEFFINSFGFSAILLLGRSVASYRQTLNK
jgi:hypothetical protein